MNLKNVDYQIKEKELAKEILFLQQYSVASKSINLKEEKASETFFDQERSLQTD